MDWQARLNRALDYIEGNLEGEVGWAEAAAEANCSTYHFLRMFEVVTGVGPGEYLRRRRLSRAAQELAAGDARIIDIALRWGYDSPEAFGKAFKREFGLSPSEARSPGATLKTWPRLSVTIVLKGNEAMEFRIENREALSLTGMPLKVKMAEGEGNPSIGLFWGRAMSEGWFKALESRIVPGSKLGVMGVCVVDPDPKSEEFTYLIAIETPRDRNGLPAACVEVRAPAASWAVFPCRGPVPASIQTTAKKIFGEWLPGSGYEVTGAPELEVYSEGDVQSPDYYCEYWVPVRKAG
jgi:AraC family transcriptional regulator